MEDDFDVIREHRQTGAESVVGLNTALSEIEALGVLVPWQLIVRKLKEGDRLLYGDTFYRKAG